MSEYHTNENRRREAPVCVSFRRDFGSMMTPAVVSPMVSKTVMPSMVPQTVVSKTVVAAAPESVGEITKGTAVVVRLTVGPVIRLRDIAPMHVMPVMMMMVAPARADVGGVRRLLRSYPLRRLRRGNGRADGNIAAE